MGAWGAVLQGVLGADSAIQGGIADQKEAQRNIALANDAAADAVRRGGVVAGAARTAGSQLEGRQKVAYTAGGVDASVGTAADVRAETVSRSELDALTLENNAAREAWGYKAHGAAFATQAGINASRNAREIAGGVIGAVGAGVNVYADYKKNRGEG